MAVSEVVWPTLPPHSAAHVDQATTGSPKLEMVDTQRKERMLHTHKNPSSLIKSTFRSISERKEKNTAGTKLV